MSEGNINRYRCVATTAHRHISPYSITRIANYIYIVTLLLSSVVAFTPHTVFTSTHRLHKCSKYYSSSNNETTSSSPLPLELKIPYTNIPLELKYKSNSAPIPIHKEIALLKSGVLIRRGEFNFIEGSRLDEVRQKCDELGGVTLTQALLIRKQLMVTKVTRNTRRLQKEGKMLEHSFANRRRTLLQLSRDIDLPPVSIFRHILRTRVDKAFPDLRDSDKKRLVKSIINEEDGVDVGSYLCAWEIDELREAKRHDAVGYADTPSENYSAGWERALCAYLDAGGVNYLTEDGLRAAAAAEAAGDDSGRRRAFATPDCLILDDCVINGRKVRWIDAKMFYASGLKESWHFVAKLKKQIAKYEAAFGESGAVVFKYGFSKRLEQEIPMTLFLDAGPLVMPDDRKE
mmetsp:Transcript_10472/g.12890  ORF Transcript_10472/g.12890 Transcript_10472/m.12890 type:complete len:402 (-) Transcript_10472:314-1519(-)|eukprot:CAMPEP_0172505024 /NCGR_PEP_ID=MMETSP1066-20121228/183054_1 /TAXON_ID=671091 /ORGANISM="Coscinodiscus wailesii, Strain CCMP2513" /LENGTH=401 /DNA_ID=CAMNT_0013281463 /DNA_START=123 /DNA_END=1328 /DNA_ORIENTATION=+